MTQSFQAAQVLVPIVLQSNHVSRLCRENLNWSDFVKRPLHALHVQSHMFSPRQRRQWRHYSCGDRDVRHERHTCHTFCTSCSCHIVTASRILNTAPKVAHVVTAPRPGWHVNATKMAAPSLCCHASKSAATQAPPLIFNAPRVYFKILKLLHPPGVF